VESLYVLNMVGAFLLLFWPLWFSTYVLRLPAFNPFTIILVFGLPAQLMTMFIGPFVIIDDGLFDAGYQYALLMSSLLAAAQAAGIIFFFRLFSGVRVDRFLTLQKVELTPRGLKNSSRVFLLIYFIALYLLASSEFGVLNWLANPRTGYQLYRAGHGHWYALAISALSVAIVLSFLSKPTARSLLYRAPFFLLLSYFLGSKGIMLYVFTTLLIFLWFLRWRQLNRLVLIGLPFIFLLMIWNFYLATTDAFELQAIIEYFDSYKNAGDYYRGIMDGGVELYSGEIFTSSFWTYVPRALWPDKPYVYGITIINELFFPGMAEQTFTPAFGGAVEQYSDFGIIGVLIFGFCSVQSIFGALMAYFVFRRPSVDFSKITLATVLLLLIPYGPAFGMFFPAALYVILLGVVIFIVWAFRRKRRSLSSPDLIPMQRVADSDT
jgi:hypothetical protein